MDTGEIISDMTENRHYSNVTTYRPGASSAPLPDVGMISIADCQM